MNLTRSALAGLVFLAGCAVGGASSQWVVPKANAQNAQRWNYFCFETVADLEEVNTKAKKAGAEGWELATSISFPDASMLWCFKRPI